MNKVKVWLLSLLVVGIYSCKDEPNDSDLKPQTDNYTGSVLICNEGNFQAGNASLSAYNPSTGFFNDDIFKTINGSNLGDVVQSVFEIAPGKLGILVNNSSKIVVIESTTLKFVKEINNIGSPRYGLKSKLINDRAYVSDLFSKKIHVINTATLELSNSIDFPFWSEHMYESADRLWITAPSQDKIYALEVSSGQITDSILVGYYANGIQIDKDNNLWVLSAGNSFEGEEARWAKINPSTKSLIDGDSIPSSYGYLVGFEINKNKDGFYVYGNGGIYTVNLAGEFSANPIFNIPFFPYKFKFDASKEEFYFTDAKDYIQKGTLYHTDKQGQKKSEKTVGIIPGEIYFN